MDKLLPCPHCGNADSPNVNALSFGSHGNSFCGWCDTNYGGCDARSGAHLTEANAIAAWNRRALAARADAAEMLAKAATVMQAHRNDGLSGALDMASEYSAAVAEHDEALAAWRAIEGEVMG